MSTNTAAILPGKNEPLVVKEVPYPTVGENDIVVRSRAIAVNPVDYAIQMLGNNLFPWITYPYILGEDVAGDVVEVGSSISHVKVGDRVVGHVIGTAASGGAFQHYPLLLSNLTSPIPELVTYEQAAVIPLAMSTAISGLFQRDYLGLQYPSLNPRPTGKTLLIWGGATSVGSNAIQLAVAAGYEVVTTCSPKNFDYVKKLGASEAFDYKASTIGEDLLRTFKGKACGGALAIAGVTPEARAQAAEACFELVAKSEGHKFVAMAVPPPEKVPEGVGCKFIFASNIKDNEVSQAIYNDYLPKALAKGTFSPSPEAEVVGKGLEAIQGALDALKLGVSAKKLVVSLP
jgi:NADPH:quinone reductase-like Zn-dependent oxidoreductase